jgi:hypothetical protein
MSWCWRGGGRLIPGALDASESSVLAAFTDIEIASEDLADDLNVLGLISWTLRP